MEGKLHYVPRSILNHPFLKGNGGCVFCLDSKSDIDKRKLDCSEALSCIHFRKSPFKYSSLQTLQKSMIIPISNSQLFLFFQYQFPHYSSWLTYYYFSFSPVSISANWSSLSALESLETLMSFSMQHFLYFCSEPQ